MDDGDDFDICLNIKNEGEVCFCDDFEMDVDKEGGVVNLFGDGYDVEVFNGVYKKKYKIGLSDGMVDSLKESFGVSEEMVIEELDDLFGGMEKTSDMVSICESLGVFECESLNVVVG